MADNITLNAGTGGASLATDDVGGVQYQRVKQTFGADGSATDVSQGSPLPVSDTGSAGILTIAAGSGTRNSNVLDLLGYTGFAAFWSSIGSGIGSGASLQFSVDNTNWFTPAGVMDVTVGGGVSFGQGYSAINSYNSSLTTGGLFWGMNYGRYVRLQCTTTTTGTYAMTFTATNGTLPNMQMGFTYVGGRTSGSDSAINPNQTAIPAVGYTHGYTGGASSVWSRVRVPNVVKSGIFSNSGNNALWTPTSGLKFRLMRYKLSVSNLATHATGSDIVFQFNDANGSTGVVEFCYVPTTSALALGTWSTGWVDLGNGYVSTTVNNVLNLNLNTSFVNGQVRAIVCGVEE
jgi:hypothetical protein